MATETGIFVIDTLSRLQLPLTETVTFARDVSCRTFVSNCVVREDRLLRIGFGINPLDLFADDQAVLCQIKKRALFSHVQGFLYFRVPNSREYENDNISKGRMSIIIPLAGFFGHRSSAVSTCFSSRRSLSGIEVSFVDYHSCGVYEACRLEIPASLASSVLREINNFIRCCSSFNRRLYHFSRD